MEHVHFIGIGGSGLSAIARLLLESGSYTVSGSDRSPSPLAHNLVDLGARLYTGHDGRNINGADIVVRSSAIPDDNPEVIAARQAGIPVLKRSDFLGRLMTGRTGIAVAGTHGKTTVTAMIAWLLVRLGQDPSYIIGGVSRDLGSNAHAGQGRAFIIEADEYDRMFLGLLPDVIVVTNMELDHPDLFPTLDDYRQAFVEFLGHLQPAGLLLSCLDDPTATSLLRELPAGCRGLTYGLTSAADYSARDVKVGPQGTFSFQAVLHAAGQPDQVLASIILQVPGEHNVLNALAALAVAHQLGLPLEPAAAALSSFSGTGRRFELIGEFGGVAIIDDYAHHPTQIRSTLAAARGRFPGRRIWAVWQPHTYTRTQVLINEYAAAFTDADQVIVTDVYAAREKNPGFSAAEVVRRMKHRGARFIAGLDEATTFLLENLRAGDVLLVLSAGDADKISADVLEALRLKEGQS
jgi:UDP-N-acetylmuramate--alanine ligase